MKRILFAPDVDDEIEEEALCPNQNVGCENVEDAIGSYYGYCSDCKRDIHNDSLVDMERDK